MSKIQWHPAFYSSMEWELREYRDKLSVETEHELSRQPLRIDMIIIKKEPGVVIDKSIAHIFRQHNLIEYKSPEDSLSIDHFYKVLGYAYLYKGLGRKINEIPLQELTVSFFRHTYPRELIHELKSEGATITQVEEGIYRVEYLHPIPIQIVVTSKLKENQYQAFKLLSKNADAEDFRRFLNEAMDSRTSGEYNNTRAILQVTMTVNPTFESVIQEDEEMGKNWAEIFDNAEQKGFDKAQVSNIKNLMDSLKISAEKAMEYLNIPKSDFSKYINML